VRKDFRLVRGSNLTYSGIARNASVIDLTGATEKWRIGPRSRYSTDVTLTEGDGITVVSATDGTYTLNLTGARTSNLDPGRYRHELEVTDSGGTIHVVLEGFIELERDMP